MRWRASAAETRGRLQPILIRLGAFVVGFGGAAVAEMIGLALDGHGRVVLGGALGLAGALLALLLLRGED